MSEGLCLGKLIIEKLENDKIWNWDCQSLYVCWGLEDFSDRIKD